MRSSILLLDLLVSSVCALPATSSDDDRQGGLIGRSASLDDVATTGFATLNGGTQGGKGGKQVQVSTLADLTAAVNGDSPAVVLITSPITGAGQNVHIGSNKSVVGKDSSVVLTNFTMTVKSAKNVIVRNLVIQKVVGNDAIAIQLSQNVWVDHVDLSSDRDHGKDYYDGLLDITHAPDYITVSNSYLHDHWKCSLIGHSDKNGAQDTGHLRVTFNNNYWKNGNSRTPSVRFGTVHVYNNYYENVTTAVDTRDGAQVLVQNSVFVGTGSPIYSTTDSPVPGYAVANGNDYGEATDVALVGNFSTVPYDVSGMLPAASVKEAVVGTAGATLKF